MDMEGPDSEITQEAPLQSPLFRMMRLSSCPCVVPCFSANVSPLVIGRNALLLLCNRQYVPRTNRPGHATGRDLDEEPGPDDLHAVVAVAEILRYLTALMAPIMSFVRCAALSCEGILQGYPFLVAALIFTKSPEVISKDIEARVITSNKKRWKC